MARLVARHRSGRADHKWTLYSLLELSEWHRVFIESGEPRPLAGVSDSEQPAGGEPPTPDPGEQARIRLSGGRLLARNVLLNIVGRGATLVAAFIAVPLLIDGLGRHASACSRSPGS